MSKFWVKNDRAVFVIFLMSIFFLFLDQVLKFQVTHGWSTPIVNDFWGWVPFFNFGIGFGIPLPAWLIIIFSLVILFLVGFLLVKNIFSKQEKFNYDLSLLLIFGGALSNFIDRIRFGYVIDYWFVLTGYINLADIMIVVGFLMLVMINSKFKFSNPK